MAESWEPRKGEKQERETQREQKPFEAALFPTYG